MGGPSMSTPGGEECHNQQVEEGGVFECESCGLREEYHYYGHKPPFCPSLTFLQPCYLMRDPFNSAASGFVLLGAECCGCGRVVCQAAGCSLYYTRTFCLVCATASMNEFPAEVQQRIQRAGCSQPSLASK